MGDAAVRTGCVELSARFSITVVPATSVLVESLGRALLRRARAGSAMWSVAREPAESSTSHWERDLGLALERTTAQLRDPLMPIRSRMSTATRKVLPSLTAAALGIAPRAVAAQVSSRPAAVNLTVVVPSRAPSNGVMTSDGIVSLVRSAGGTEIETRIGLVNREPARIEVRLGSTWRAESTRVWVRNAMGAFQPLIYGTGIIAVDSPFTLRGRKCSFSPRLERHHRIAGRYPARVPLTVGSGDEFSGVEFPVDSARHRTRPLSRTADSASSPLPPAASRPGSSSR